MRFWAYLLVVANTLATQPSAVEPKAAPLRELPWGQLNFLHTTDTHGWHAGHLLEPSFSADWGDYISFASHLRSKADKDGSDLLVIDTGDRIEGNGLYDSSDPKGKFTFEILKYQKIDVICSGNHELYKNRSSFNELDRTVPDFKNSYLASNLDIYNPVSGEFEALAPRFKKLTTKNQGIRIVAFGFLYNFEQNSNNTIVQKVQDTVEEQWFRDAIEDHDVDLFLVIGHVAIRDSIEFDAIFRAIRKHHWFTPIQFFGGHTHIRDYKKYDSRSYAIESGRFMETIGFMSISGLTTNMTLISPSSTPSFGRRYIDNNLFSFYHHTGFNESTFPTELGVNVSGQISDARTQLNLNHRYGCAPRDLWLSRVPYNDQSSIFDWLGNRVMSEEFKNSKNESTPKIILTNTGAIRFDIFKGPFTRDTKYQVSPFTSGFNYLPNVPYSMARRLLLILNSEPQALADLGLDSNLELLALQKHIVTNISERHFTHDGQVSLKNELELTPGYTTIDDAGDDGDDTMHSFIKFYRIPNVIQTSINIPENDNEVEQVDVYYNAFLEQWVFLALRFLGKEYSIENRKLYLAGKPMTEIISDWIENNWPCESGGGIDEL